MKDSKIAFWKEYKESDEIKQRELLQKLTGTKEENEFGFFKYMTLSLFKSYIDDCIEEQQ